MQLSRPSASCNADRFKDGLSRVTDPAQLLAPCHVFLRMVEPGTSGLTKHREVLLVEGHDR